ncbi:MAG: FAD-dependent monooxygenase [Rhodothermales bacterium]
MKIGVIGGSIAGCATAIVLARSGHDVRVFERSASELKGRGAGIATSPAVLQSLKDEDLLDDDIPFFHIEALHHVGKAEQNEPDGSKAGVLPVELECMNWGDLQRNLRCRVKDEVYLKDHIVHKVENLSSHQSKLTLKDGKSFTFDLIVCADGYRSVGRASLFPEAALNYRGYVLWRGVLDEAQLNDTTPLESKMQRIGYNRAHGVFYFVPGEPLASSSNNRLVNWALYMPVPKDELSTFLVDRTGKKRSGSIAPGEMRSEQELALKRLAKNALPSYYAQIIEKSQSTFIQAIYTMDVPAYYKGRICLVGDAGFVAQPFTASGVFKSISNAKALSNALISYNSLEEALSAWSHEQIALGRRLKHVGEKLEHALIWDIPDFSTIKEEELNSWFKSLASASYVKK